MGTARTVDTGREDTLGRIVKESEGKGANRVNSTSRIGLVGAAGVSASYGVSENYRPTGDVMADHGVYGEYMREDMPDELWSDISGGDDLDEQFRDSEQFAGFVRSADKVVREKDLVWVDDGGEISYDPDGWDENKSALSSQLSSAYDSWTDSQITEEDGYDVRGEENRSIVDGLTNSFEDTYDDFVDGVFDGQEPDGWHDFVGTEEAKRIIADEVDEYEIASLGSDGSVHLNLDALHDRRLEFRDNLMAAYRDHRG